MNHKMLKANRVKIEKHQNMTKRRRLGYKLVRKQSPYGEKSYERNRHV